jgi:hypothetical protein
MTITEQQQQAIREYFAGRHIPAGLGDEHAASSLAGINLALSGRLTTEIPDCMSEQIGRWIVRVQEAMTDDVRNSDRWRELLPRAAGTGRQHEERRAQMILEWMWETVLPYIQPLADKGGYGDAWRAMCQERTADAAAYAANAAKAVGYAAAYVVADVAAAYAANAANAADVAAARAAYVAAYVADAAAAAYVADAVGYAAADATRKQAWEHFDACGLLERLIAVSEMEPASR